MIAPEKGQIVHKYCQAADFLDRMETELNGTLFVDGDVMYLAVLEGPERKVLYMAPDMRAFSEVEKMLFVADVMLTLQLRGGSFTKRSWG